MSAWLPMDARSSRLQQIEDREEEDPDQVEEVPEEARVLDAVREVLGIGLPELRPGSPEVSIHRHAADHVQAVQSGEREVDRQEGALARQQALVELVRVLEVLDEKEAEATEHRHCLE